MGMNGFVRSRRPAGVYCMKRHINPGQKVSLDELYDQYGISNDIQSGPDFIKWLRTVKLNRRDIWEIMYNEMSIVSGEEPFEALRRAEEARVAAIAVVEEKEESKIEEAKEEPVAEEIPVLEEAEAVEKLEEPKAEKVQEVAETPEEPMKKMSGKIQLEGDIKVDDSGGMSFSFPSSKENAPDKSEKINDKSKFTKIKTSGGSVKAVRARNDGLEKPAFTPADILEFKVNDFDKIDKVKDIKILKIALKSAEDMRNKATLCKRLKTRIGRLKPRSRFGSV